jgi:hypothetical protein
MSKALAPNLEGLGRLQRTIIVKLSERHREYLAAGMFGMAKRARTIGVHWRIGGTPTRRANYSRALRSLERRGIVILRKGRARTLAVQVRREFLLKPSAKASRLVNESSV